MRSCLVGFTLLLLLAGCDEETPPLVLPPPPAPPPRAIVASPRPVSGPGAFDLIITDEGPLLIFGPPSPVGGGLRVLSLGPKGEAEGAERTLAGGASAARQLAPQSEEIVAAASGGRLRIAWVERDQLAFTTRTMMVDGDARSPGAMEDLGATSRTRTGRGSLAMAAHEGSFDLLYRASDGPCNTAQAEASAGRCARFSIHRAGGASTGRRGGGLSVPSICRAPVLGFVTSSTGVWYEAICALEEGTPRTTVFALQFEPEYAHAEPVLSGCVPRPMTSVGDGVVLSAHCEGLRSVWISSAGREVQTFDVAPVLRCEGGRPVWKLGEHRLEFSEPRDRLEGLMNPNEVSEHARAAWTGESLLVADSVGDEVAIRRFECDGDSFRRTDHEAL